MSKLAAPADAPRVPLQAGLKPMQQLDRTLCEIDSHFGETRQEWVRMELEYAAQPECAAPLQGEP